MEWLIEHEIDLARGIDANARTRNVFPLAYPGDQNAHKWQVKVKYNGEDYDITGASVTGYFFRQKDNETPFQYGEASGNTASVLIPVEAYAYPGYVTAIMRATVGGQIVTLDAITFSVGKNLTGSIIDSGEVIPSFESFLAELERMESANDKAEELIGEMATEIAVSDVYPYSSGLGAIVNVKDSAKTQLRDLKLYGRSTQSGTPTPTNPVAIQTAGSSGTLKVRTSGKNLVSMADFNRSGSGASISVSGNTLTVTGTGAAAHAGTTTSSGLLLPHDKRYYIRMNVTALSAGTTLRVGFRTVSDNIFRGYYAISSTGAWSGALRPGNNGATEPVYLSITVSEAAAYSFTVSDIQVELVDTSATAPSDFEAYKGTTASVPITGGLPGVPYIEDNTTKWVSDEIDLAAGTHTQRVGTIASYAGETLPGAWLSSMDVYAEGGTPTTGASVVYALATPITTDLTAAQVAAIQTLYSQHGTTNVHCDSAPMPDVYAEVYQNLSTRLDELDELSASVTALERDAVLATNTMITDESTAAAIGGDLDNCEDNRIYCVGIGTAGLIAHKPYSNFRGTVICFNFRRGNDNAKTQIAVDYQGRSYQRICWTSSNTWTEWTENASAPQVYALTASDSLVDLLIELRGDEREKVIYLAGGNYDIFSQYQNAVNAGTLTMPPDNVVTSDYFYPYNAFLPANTTLIGRGDVTLQWTPTVAQLNALAHSKLSSTSTGVGAAKTWSPINVLGSCLIENITIRVKNGRYCIHDDPHSNYPDALHVYRNVHCVYDECDTVSGVTYGNNTVIGFGWANTSRYVFEDCDFYYNGTGARSAFYGHDAGYTLGANGSASIVARNCVMRTNSSNTTRLVRLQTLSTGTTPNHVNTRFEGCVIAGDLYLQEYYATSYNAFDVALVNSGAPTVTYVNRGGETHTNPYPVAVYNSQS